MNGLINFLIQNSNKLRGIGNMKSAWLGKFDAPI